MSRSYHMGVTITNFNKEKKEEIKEAADKEWAPFTDDWFDSTEEAPDDLEPTLSAQGEGSLCGGEDEDKFADRLTETVWKANGAFCKVNVAATCLEYIPCERYEKNKDDYQKFIEREEKE